MKYKEGLYKKLSAPISVQIEITSNCNNNCIYCYNHWREKRQISFMSLSSENLIHICNQLKDSKIFSATLTGGEPLLVWKQLLAAIEHLKQANINVNLNSNLTLITPEIARALKKSGLKTILASILSSDEKIHDQLSNCKGAWKQTIKGIKVAIAHDLRVSANMVLLKQNHKFIYETVEFLKSIGIYSFSATKASPSLNSRNFSEFRLSVEELRTSLNILETIKEKLEMNVDILECYPLCLLSDLNKFWHYGRRNCTAGITTCTIGSDGGIRPCSHSDMSYGNVFKERLVDIFSRMTDWRDGRYIPDDCKYCAYLKMCSGGCRMEAKHLGDICGKDPYMTNSDDVIPKSFDVAQINKISLNQKYLLKPNFRWRVEEFGAVIAVQESSPLLVNNDGFDILRKLSNSSFSVVEMAKETNSGTESIKTFFSRLLKSRFIFISK